MDNDTIITLGFTAAFTAWAGVLAWLGNRILARMDKLADSFDKEAAKLNGYIIQTESRLSVLEDRAGVNSGARPPA